MIYTPTRSSRRGFTLIELLAVIAIAGFLMVLVLPAFTGMTRSANINSAMSELRTTMSLARQWAITRHEDTYIVFPADDTVYPSGRFTNHMLRAYSVWTESAGYIRDWTVLPEGVFFDPEAPPRPGYGTGNANVFSVSNNWVQWPVAYPDSSYTQDMYCIAFLPSGRLKEAGGGSYHAWLFLTEGWVDPGASTFQRKPNGITNGFYIKELTGQTRVVKEGT